MELGSGKMGGAEPVARSLPSERCRLDVTAELAVEYGTAFGPLVATGPVDKATIPVDRLGSTPVNKVG